MNILLTGSKLFFERFFHMRKTVQTNDNGLISYKLDKYLISIPELPPSLIRNTETLATAPDLTSLFFIPTGYTVVTSFESIYTGKTIIVYQDDNNNLLLMAGFYKYANMNPASLHMEAYGVSSNKGKIGDQVDVTFVQEDLEEGSSGFPAPIPAGGITAALLNTVEMGNPDLSRASIINTMTGNRIVVQSTIPVLTLSLNAPVKYHPWFIVPTVGTGHKFMKGQLGEYNEISIPVLL